MKNTSFFIAFSVIFLSTVCCSSALAQQKKYTVEYGTLEYKTENHKLYFIDHGNRYREEFTRNGVTTTNIYDGTHLYSRQSGRIDTMAVRNRYYNSADPAGFRRERNFKTLPPKTIAGKECTGFEYYNSVLGQTVVLYEWNNLTMYQSIDGTVYLEAVRFDPSRPTVSFQPGR